MIEIVHEAQIRWALALEIEPFQQMPDGGGLAGAGEAEHEDVEAGTADLQPHLQRRQGARLSNDLRAAAQVVGGAEAERLRVALPAQLLCGQRGLGSCRLQWGALWHVVGIPWAGEP